MSHLTVFRPNPPATRRGGAQKRDRTPPNVGRAKRSKAQHPAEREGAEQNKVQSTAEPDRPQPKNRLCSKRDRLPCPTSALFRPSPTSFNRSQPPAMRRLGGAALKRGNPLDCRRPTSALFRPFPTSLNRSRPPQKEVQPTAENPTRVFP